MVLIGRGAFPAIRANAAYPENPRHTVDSLINISKRLMLKIPDSARRNAEHALVISKKNNYKFGIGQSLNAVGVSYWVKSFLPMSQFYLLSAGPYLKGHNDALVSNYIQIGRNYIDLKDYPKASWYFKQALRLVGPDIDGKAAIYTELTLLYYATKNYASSLRYIDTSLKYSRITDNTTFISILYNRRAQIYISQEKPDLASHMLDTSYRLSLETKNKRLQTICFIDWARIYLLKKDPDVAIDYANKGLLLADTLGVSGLKLRSLRILNRIYLQQGKLQQANQAQAMAIKLYEDLGRVNNQKILQLIQDYFSLNNKLNDIELIARNNSANEVMIKTQHRTIALLVVLLVTAITFLVIIYINYKQKNQMNTRLQLQHKVLLDQKKLIEIQHTDLEDLNRLKNKLLAIIGHDLRTPIASLSSITDLFAVNYITADEVAKLMLELGPIVKGAELTLSNLMEFADSQIKGQHTTASNLNMYLIADEMKETFKHQLQLKSITFSNNCLSSKSIWADANHVKVILRNLISNAVKFTNNGGHINVFSSVRNKEMLLCVQDSGVGMDPAEANKLFNANLHFSQQGTSGEKGTGLGLLLCKELIALNNGKIWVEALAGKGCNFYFTLPLCNLAPESQA